MCPRGGQRADVNLSAPEAGHPPRPGRRRAAVNKTGAPEIPTPKTGFCGFYAPPAAQPLGAAKARHPRRKQESPDPGCRQGSKERRAAGGKKSVKRLDAPHESAEPQLRQPVGPTTSEGCFLPLPVPSPWPTPLTQRRAEPPATVLAQQRLRLPAQVRGLGGCPARPAPGRRLKAGRTSLPLERS